MQEKEKKNNGGKEEIQTWEEEKTAKKSEPMRGGGEPKLSERKKTIKPSDLHEEKKSRRLCVKAFE